MDGLLGWISHKSAECIYRMKEAEAAVFSVPLIWMAVSPLDIKMCGRLFVDILCCVLPIVFAH